MKHVPMIAAAALALCFVYLAIISSADAQTNPVLTTEVLVGTTATAMPQLPNRRGVELQNLGPNPIYCALTDATKAVVGRARRVDAGGSWALDIPSTTPIYCIAATAAQVTGAATIATEAR
jgi:hypothetical protein